MNNGCIGDQLLVFWYRGTFKHSTWVTMDLWIFETKLLDRGSALHSLNTGEARQGEMDGNGELQSIIDLVVVLIWKHIDLPSLKLTAILAPENRGNP